MYAQADDPESPDVCYVGPYPTYRSALLDGQGPDDSRFVQWHIVAEH